MDSIISIDELISAYAQADKSSYEGHTMLEIVEKSGMPAERCRRIIGSAIKDGSVRVSRRRVVDISGRVQQVPSYVLIKKSRSRTKS